MINQYLESLCGTLLVSLDQPKFDHHNTDLPSGLSIILGHTATVLSTPGAELVPFMSTLLNGELQRFREAMPDSLTRNATPMVFLAFWHLRLLIQSSTPSNDRADLINQATPGVAVLAEIRHRSPLDHYFSGLAMLILSELYNIESTRDEA